MRLIDMPIQRKLTTMILVTSGVVLLLTCAAFIGYEYFTFRQSEVRELSTLADIIATQSTGAVAFDNPKDATEILGALRAQRHIVAAALYDREGLLFARYPAKAPVESFPSSPDADGFRYEDGQLVGYTPLVQVPGSARLGTLYLRNDMGALRERLRLYGGIALLVFGIASTVAFLLSRYLQRGLSRQILSLAETARVVSERRDYSVRAAKHSQDELGVLTDALNHMLAQVQEQNAILERRVRERTAELEAANDELEAFGSSAAHDLRTPLRAIKGFAEILLDERAGELSPEARRYATLIRDGSAQMGKLIEDLLSFSRLGRQELALQDVDLAALCRDIWEGLAHDLGNRKVELSLDTLPTVRADPALMRVVFVNLLSNALKYTRDRASAYIEVGVQASQPGQAPVLYVRDNGVGFDMQNAGKLFGVFQRLHLAHEFEGTGVGLATTRRIIERHGGRIWAEAKPERGATFYFVVASR